jgi:uncharacterized protein YfiM (DUF2279 family)
MRRILLLFLLALPAPLAAQETPGAYGVEQTWTSRDTLYHFGIAAVGAAASYSLARALGAKRWPAVAISVGFTGGLGVLREVQDSRREDKYFSEKDLLWDAAGITVGIVIPDRLFFRKREKEESPG